MVMSVFLYRSLSLDPQKLPSTYLNKPAPLLPGVSAKMKGQVWLLNVWATWCGACQVEPPVMMDISKSSVAIVGLDFKDDDDRAKQWLEQYGDPYLQVISDNDGHLGIDWGVYGAPETFIIDKQGVIRHRHVGQVTHEIWQKQLKPIIESLS